MKLIVHIMLMIGTPGTGKTMLAQRLPTILPPLTPAESLETTRIYSPWTFYRVFSPHC
jgi:magnesium chelatase family protein